MVQFAGKGDTVESRWRKMIKIVGGFIVGIFRIGDGDTFSFRLFAVDQRMLSISLRAEQRVSSKYTITTSARFSSCVYLYDLLQFYRL